MAWIQRPFAEVLGLSTEIVHGYLKTVYTKLQVRRRTEAALRFRG